MGFGLVVFGVGGACVGFGLVGFGVRGACVGFGLVGFGVGGACVGFGLVGIGIFVGCVVVGECGPGEPSAEGTKRFVSPHSKSALLVQSGHTATHGHWTHCSVPFA